MAKRKRNLLDAALIDSSSAFCVLDGERRIRFVSPGLQELTGWPAEEVEGLSCSPGIADHGSDVDLLTASLMPARTVVEGAVETLATVLPRRNGTSLRVHLTFIPVQDAGGAVTRIVIYCDTSGRPLAATPSISQQLHAEVTALRTDFRRRFSAQSFVGSCPAIRRALSQAEMLKTSNAGYTVIGPSGSGRKHFARMVHAAGRHSDHSIVPLECRLLTAEQVIAALRTLRQLREQETAGHRHAGTLLFVDAESCPREVQTWVMENLAEQLAEVRVAATTEVDLATVVEEGWMTGEFHEMLNTMHVHLPPLHHRGDDVELLAQHFIMESRRTQETSAESLTSDVLDAIQFYRWPGNVRELQNVIQQACQNSFDSQLVPDDLPFSFKAGVEAQSMPPMPTDTARNLEAILHQFEIDVLKKTLKACRGNKAEAARRLGLTRPKLYRRLKTLGIEERDDDSTT